MKVVFMGTPDFAVPALEALVEAGHSVLAVYTQPPRPAGRGKKDRPSPVQRAAETLGIPVRYPASLRAPDVQTAFAALGADVAVVAAYGLILPQAILDAPRLGCLNIHASLLPRWRGAAPIHRSILAGDTETGVCIMQMEAGLDTGPILLRATTPIGPEDTTDIVHDRLAAMGAEALLQSLDQIDFLSPVPQPQTGITYAEKIDKSEARIAWDQPAATIDRQIRGLSPFPGAWTTLNGKRLKLIGSRLAPGSGTPGTVLSGLTIACGSGALDITMLQAEGRGRQTQADFLRGTPVPPGTKLGEDPCSPPS